MIVGLVVTLNLVFGMIPKLIFAESKGTFLAFLYPRLSVNKTSKSEAGYRVATPNLRVFEKHAQIAE